MTPIEPGEDVDESEVMNVQDEHGVWHRYRKRKMGVTHMRNGKFSNNFYQGAVRAVDGLKMLIYVLGIIGGFLWGMTEWVVIPQLERKIEATALKIAKPMNDRLTILEDAQAEHMRDTQRRTDQEMRDEIERLRAQIAKVNRE